MAKVWGPHPLKLTVVETLEKKGPTTDTDLYKELKESLGDLSFRELNRVLMKLELTGIVRVSRLARGKRRVELVGRSP